MTRCISAYAAALRKPTLEPGHEIIIKKWYPRMPGLDGAQTGQANNQATRCQASHTGVMIGNQSEDTDKS